MTDRPILFSAPMIIALLDDRKTQTRRSIKLPHQNPLGIWEATTIGGKGVYFSDGSPAPERAAIWHTRTGDCIAMKHDVGDRLWVREAWRSVPEYDGLPPREIPARSPRNTMADTGLTYPSELWGKLRPSMFMPRWASRLTLVVEGVKVERLQDISEQDAIAEGVVWQEPTDTDREWAKAYAEENGCSDEISGIWIAPGTRQGFGMTKADKDRPQWGPTAAFAYRCLWDPINGPGSWEANPWIVAYSFRVIKGNIDRLPSSPALLEQDDLDGKGA